MRIAFVVKKYVHLTFDLIIPPRERIMSETPNDIKYAASHEWARKLEDNIIEVGISDYAQSALGDVVYVELPDVGRTVDASEECCAIESVKAASDIYAPISGEVVAVNEELGDAPELLNEEPYARGWMFRIKAADISELDNLLDAEAYMAQVDD
jgi:glycine cleavage system H protein